MSDLIKITGLSFFAYHGVYAFETKNGQEFVVNARLWLDAADAAREDNLDKSVNYGAVCDLIVSYLQQHTFKLLEAAVYHVMKEILIQFPLIKQMEFELCKPQAPIAHPFENVSVTMEMGWHTAYIALGSNMGDKERYILDAVRKLEDDTDFRSIHMSRLIVTNRMAALRRMILSMGRYGVRRFFRQKNCWQGSTHLRRRQSASGKFTGGQGHWI